MTSKADLTDEVKRDLHKLWRSLHDGICPQCGSEPYHHPGGYSCRCGFDMSTDEANEIATMCGDRPVNGRAIAAFHEWRNTR